jgi:1-acyl-sn-glycerol-3-phosphate acyltransferase
LPDADVIPFASPQEPRRPVGPSKAARMVGNTGPQPPAPEVERSRPVDRGVPATPADPAPSTGPVLPSPDDDEGWIEFLRRRLGGDYGVDDFGFDPELTDRVLLALVRPLYRSWFRVETTGLENVPADSAALMVANHSGTIAMDSVMAQVALHDEHPAHRHLRMLGANLVFQTPFMGEIARKAGHTLACHPDAERLLGAGELVGVWPEGFKGVGKPFSQRYKLQRFGRGGFVAAALRTGAPIIPTAIVGAEEIYPMIANFGTLARILGLPYFPITPTFPWLGPLGMIPLPSKWMIHFGEPIPTDHFPEGAADDPMVVFNLTDQVREQIQQQLYRLLVKRPSAFG